MLGSEAIDGSDHMYQLGSNAPVPVGPVVPVFV